MIHQMQKYKLETDLSNLGSADILLLVLNHAAAN
jgi:hypothetical protein